MSNPIILIPARLAATRLPNKPLAEIGGEPMIVHVWRRAVASGVGPVAVATDSVEIADAIEKAGGQAVMTGSHHASGSDRIFEAVEKLDPEGRHDLVVNVQGDFPTIRPETIAASLTPLADPAVDVATLVAVIDNEADRLDPNVPKMVGTEISPGRLRALYFSRATLPYGEGPHYVHIGLYAYRREALRRFVGLPASPLEIRERLEQLRALEAGMRIDAMVVGDVPLGVDTASHLERVRAMIAAGSQP